MRHANSQGALRDGRGDAGWVASNDNTYGQNGRGNYAVYPGSGSNSEPFSPASSTMSGLSLPSPVSVSGGNALPSAYGGSSASGGYGSDQSRQFPPVRSYGQGSSTTPQAPFNQERPTGQQQYSLSPAAWHPSTPQPGSQGHTPPNESPQIPPQQPNLLPRLQPVPSPMAPPSYATQPSHYNWYSSQQHQRPQLPPFGQMTQQNNTSYPPPAPTASDTTLRTPILGGHNQISPVHRQTPWGGGSSYSSYPHQQYDAPSHGHHQPVQNAFPIEAATARDREDEEALLRLSRATARDDVNVKTEDLNGGMPMGGSFDAP